MKPWQVLRSKVLVDRRPWLQVTTQDVKLPNGHVIQGYMLAEGRDYAMVFALMEDGRVPVVQQYKHGVARLTYDLPAGYVDEGEQPLACAHRELMEETGLAGTLEPLGLSHSFWVDPAIVHFPDEEPRFNTETCFAMEVPADAAVRLEAAEHSEFTWCGFDEALALMKWEGSKAALALLRAKLGA